jgi:hypothetical protein
MDNKTNKDWEDKRNKQKDNQQQRYQTAINKCVTTKQGLTMVDLRAMVKQATKKGDKPMEKGRSELLEQLQQRFHCLQSRLLVASCNEIHMHLVQQGAKAPKVTNKNNTRKSDEIGMFDKLEVANMSETIYDSTGSTTGIFDTGNLEIFDVPEDAASSLLDLAKAQKILICKLSDWA